MIEVYRIEPIADVLLVERRRIGADRIAFLRPETRRIRRKNLIGKYERTVTVASEFEFRVCDYYTMPAGIIGRAGVEIYRRFFQLRGKIRTDDGFGLFVIDGFVVVADGGLRRGGEKNFVKLGSVLVAVAKLFTVHSAGVSLDGSTVTAGGEGTALLSCELDGQYFDCLVEVTEKVVTWSISHTDVTIKVGESFYLKVKNEEGETADVDWSASKSGYVTISGNKITGKKAGTVTVSCKFEGKTYSCIVRVKSA